VPQTEKNKPESNSSSTNGDNMYRN